MTATPMASATANREALPRERRERREPADQPNRNRSHHRDGHAPESQRQKEPEQERPRQIDAERCPRKPGLIDTQTNRVPSDRTARTRQSDPKKLHRSS